MTEPTPLSKADHEIMTSRGWNTDDPATVSKYQDLRERANADKISEHELSREMNKFEVEQYIKGNRPGPEQDTGRKGPDNER